jgi:hypothetical protein
VPLRYNNGVIEFYDTTDDTWKEAIPSSYLMLLSLQNYEGDMDLQYPLGVFSVNNTFLGIADSAEEYMTLWNSNVDNQAVGTIVSGESTTFEVAVKYINTPNINLYGLEYYTFRSSSAAPVMHVTDNDIIQYNTTVVLGSSGANVASTTKNEYNGVFGVASDSSFNLRTVTLSGITSTTDINIFHSRVSERVGMDTLTPCTYIAGKLPSACKSFTVRTPGGVSLVTNVVNWNELTSIETFNLVNLGGVPYDVSDDSHVPVLPASLVALGLGDLAVPAATPDKFTWITAANLPNLRRIKLGCNNLDMLTFAANWFATLPPADKYLHFTNNGGPACSAAISDLIINNLWTALSAVTPVSPASIRLQNTSTRTAASDVSFNNLVAAGWTIALT